MAELFDNWHIDLVTAHSADEALQWLDTIGRVPDTILRISQAGFPLLHKPLRPAKQIGRAHV